MAASLQIVHVLPQRVRLRWHADLEPDALDLLCGQLQGQPWLRELHRRDASRSLVLELLPDCPYGRWQAALAALGWRLEDPFVHASPQPQDAADDPWAHLSRQLGGSMAGAALGQVLIGGACASIAAAAAGPAAALVCGGLGAVVGAVFGSIAGSAIADGRAGSLSHSFVQLGWRGLSTRMGEEVGSRSGVALGTALAGPVGAVAGLAVGSMLGGQLAADLSGPASVRAGIGRGGWFAGVLRNGSAETLSEHLGAGLGARISGGSEVGRQLGAKLSGRFAKRVNWDASLHQHHLVASQSARPLSRPSRAGITERIVATVPSTNAAPTSSSRIA